MQPTTAAISLDVILGAVFGIETPAARERWSDAIRRYAVAAHPAPDAVAALSVPRDRT